MSEKYQKIEKSGSNRWDEFSQNVYQDIKTFNNSFRKAGTLFRPGEEKDYPV